MFDSYVAIYRVFLTFLLLLSLLVAFVATWLGAGFGTLIIAYILVLPWSWWCVPVFLFGPLGAIALAYYVSGTIAFEANNVRVYGEKYALWNTVQYSPRHPGVPFTRMLIWQGHDKSGEWLSYAISAFNLPAELQDAIGDGIAVFGSVVWSRFILTLEKATSGSQSLVFSCLCILWMFKFPVKHSYKMLSRLYLGISLVFVFLWHVPPEVAFDALWAAIQFLARLSIRYKQGDFSVYLEWMKWRLVYLITTVTGWFVALNSEVAKYHSAQLSGGTSSLMTHFRLFTMQASVFITDLGLPNYVRRRFKPEVTQRGLEASLALMSDLGWPINVNLTEPQVQAGFDTLAFKEWVLCGSDFRTGIHNLKTYVDKDLQLIKSSLIYKRTEDYMTEKNELESTSRYFKKQSYDFPDLDLDDVWFVLRDIFKNSRLTPFNYIINKWEKKYALGSFMTDPDNGKRKYQRKKFISDLGGYGAFKKLWQRTFYYATMFLPVSAVSVKGEALPERKWARDKVRSIIGSPITQYILSTIWNYGPNHRFAWESTPIKVGMPLNGFWMASVWARHSRCQIHTQGDFEAFDSTITGPVMDIIKALRKRGYEHHKDRLRIAELIDINYEQVAEQLLNTTSNGNVYTKGTGLTTGHSSTSMDNSVACVVLYLLAWKDITGLSAKEFLHYNELSCYGDDHMLSFLATKPASWTPRNIRSTMARWGLKNDVEVKHFRDLEFLSKKGRVATAPEISWLKSIGLDSVRFIVWHDKDKLVGKLTAKVRSLQPSYKLSRLLSYLSLTAHHPDVYDGIVNIIKSSKSMMSMMKNNNKSIPSYEKVVRDWYASSPPPSTTAKLDEEVEEGFNSDKLVEYGSTNAMDSIFGALSMLPDLLSPTLFNYGYNKAFQLFMLPRLGWVVDFIAANNNASSMSALSYFMSRTPYRWVEPSLFVPGTGRSDWGAMVVRHWLYLLYFHLRPVRTFGAGFNFVTTRVASLQFILNGKLFNEAYDNRFSLDLIIVAALLSYVDFPSWFTPMRNLTLPDLNLLMELVSHFFLVTVWASVPPNYKEVTPILRKMKEINGHVCVSAPTGTGKSTSFVHHVGNVVGHRFRKIIVIEPRSSLVKGLVAYMNSSYGDNFSGSTTGLKLDKSKKTYYMTPQALFNQVDLLNHNNLFILDEAHINEEWYILSRRVLTKTKMPRIFVSATLPESLLASCASHIEIPLAQIWSVNRMSSRLACSGMPTKEVLNLVVSKAVDVANNLNPGDKALFFLPRQSDCDKAVEMCKKRSRALHSAVGVPEVFDDQVYFSTDITDVGITIPSLTYVWTSSIAQVHNGFRKISAAQIGQRSGRTGRTNNGTFMLVNLDLDYTLPEKTDSLDASVISDMLLSGLPVELAIAFDRSMALNAIGLSNANLDRTQENELLRAASVYYKNFNPVIQGFVAAAESGSEAFGKPVVLHHTGTGNISSSALQPGEDRVQHVRQLALDVVQAGLMHQPIPRDNPSLLSLSAIAGPILRVANLVSCLVNDPGEGKTDALNQKNSVPTGSLSDVFEFGKILKLLNELE
ncbi:RNA dependent RNA polymerase RdRP [Botrytis cinerea fusarivirus 8]|uniref:RNA dependent RNA polymerase RdRP n=1 Tax=Botrytis cinerea fusarivirus 8 TaxID=2912861 RepID=A0AAE9NXG7_9VIRU|nr:RNA dependent RNA polymerase RdRP [Botrytis cinerea fusarivirus 8]